MRTLLFLLLIYSTQAVSQTSPGEEIVYFNEEFNTCAKEDAYYVGITINKDEETDVIVYHPNGKQALTGTYLNKNLHKRNGTFTWFDTNGIRIAVAGYKNNLQDGLYLFWYSNKVLRDSGYFNNGIPDGLWKSWYSNGQLRMICVYNARGLSDYKKTYANNNVAAELVQLAKPQKVVNLTRLDPAQDVSPRARRAYMNNLREKDNQFNSIINGGAGDEQNKSIQNTDDNQHVYFSHVIIRYDLISPATVMLDGDYYTFYYNGQQKEAGSYKEGFKKGFWETWYENSKRQSIGKYEKYHEVQEWKYYNSDGELLMVRQYKKNGRLSIEIKMK